MISLVRWPTAAIILTMGVGVAIADAPAPESVKYACESGQTIVVRYDDSNPDAPTATLEYKARSFEMYNVQAQSGRRFATEQGLTPDRGLQWITNEGSAVLSEMLMDHTAPEPTPIETCKPAS